MTIPEALPTLQTLQQIKDCVVQSETELSVIKSPVTEHEENVAKVNALLDEAFRQLREQRHPDNRPKIQDEIVRFAGELKILEIKHKDGLEDAERMYERRIATALQRLCDKLIAAMGSAVVQMSLQNLSSENLGQYLPANTCGGIEESVQANADPNGHDADARIGVSGRVYRAKRDISGNTEQCPTKKRRISTNQRELGGELQGQSGSRARISPLREQRSEAVNSNEADSDDVFDKGNNHSENHGSKTTNGGETQATPEGSDGPNLTHRHTGSDDVGLASTGHPTTSHKNQNPATGNVLVYVIGADGNPIGAIERVEPWNQRLQKILHLPVLRPVKIRRGRNFEQDHLARICDLSGPKVQKILSFLIQATGKIMDKRCQACETNRGIFEDCIRLSGPRFPRCGNCEWGRQGCHGASMDDVEGRDSKATPQPIDSNTPRSRKGQSSLSESATLQTNPLIETSVIPTPEMLQNPQA